MQHGFSRICMVSCGVIARCLGNPHIPDHHFKDSIDYSVHKNRLTRSMYEWAILHRRRAMKNGYLNDEHIHHQPPPQNGKGNSWGVGGLPHGVGKSGSLPHPSLRFLYYVCMSTSACTISSRRLCCCAQASVTPCVARSYPREWRRCSEFELMILGLRQRWQHQPYIYHHTHHHYTLEYIWTVALK